MMFISDDHLFVISCLNMYLIICIYIISFNKDNFLQVQTHTFKQTCLHMDWHRQIYSDVDN